MAKKRKYKMTAAHKAALRAAHKKRRGKPRAKNKIITGLTEAIELMQPHPRRLGRPPKNIIAGNRQATGFSTRLNAAIERLETVANRLEKVLS